MVKRCRRAAKRHVSDYRQAIAGFTHNASIYLRSGFLQGAGAGILATVFGIYIKTAGMPESVVGNVEAGVAFTAAVVSLLGPPLVAAVGYRKLMVGALGLIIISRLGQAALPTSIALVGFALAIGLGDGFMRTISSAFLSTNSSKDERTHLFSTELVVRVAAGFLGGLVGGFLPAILGKFMPEVNAYQWTIVAGTAVMGLGLLPMLKMRDKSPDVEKLRDAYITSARHFQSWGHAAKLIGPQLFISLGGGLVLPFVPLYLKHHLGADIAQIGVIQGLASVVLGFAAFGTPVIARKLGLVRGVALMQMLSVPFLAAIPFAGSLLLSVGLLWGRGACMNMAGPMYNQFSMEDVPERDKPLVAGLMFFALNMMWLVGNLLGGRIMEYSYTTPYVVAIFLYLTGATLTLLVWRNHGREVALQPAAEAA